MKKYRVLFEGRYVPDDYFDFASVESALAYADLRALHNGVSRTKYRVEELEFGPPSLSSQLNPSCKTCREPFPYDPLPSNRADGGTDCYRCKTMKGVFL